MTRLRRLALSISIAALAGCGLTIVGIDVASSPDAGADATAIPRADAMIEESIPSEPDARLDADAGLDADVDAAPTVLLTVSPDAGVRAVAVDKGRLFYADDVRVVQITDDGGITEVLSGQNVTQFAVKDNALWYTNRTNGVLHRKMIDSSTDDSFQSGPDIGCVSFDPDGTTVWTGAFQQNSIVVVPFGGGNPSLQINNIDRVWGVAVSATSLYFTRGLTDVVMRSTKDGGGAETVIATAQGSPQCITLDDAGHMYWPEFSGAGAIHRANVDGSNPIVLATGQINPTQIAFDANFLYWNSDNKIMRLPRPQ